MPSCTHCGKEFGNEGAKASHEKTCQSKDEAVVLEPEEQGNLPASDSTPSGAVAALLQAATASGNNDEMKKEAVKTIGSGLTEFATRQIEQRQQQAEYAKGVDVEPVEDKPSCPNCNATFTRIPPEAPRVQCGSCGMECRVIPK